MLKLYLIQRLYIYLYISYGSCRTVEVDFYNTKPCICLLIFTAQFKAFGVTFRILAACYRLNLARKFQPKQLAIAKNEGKEKCFAHVKKNLAACPLNSSSIFAWE